MLCVDDVTLLVDKPSLSNVSLAVVSLATSQGGSTSPTRKRPRNPCISYALPRSAGLESLSGWRLTVAQSHSIVRWLRRSTRCRVQSETRHPMRLIARQPSARASVIVIWAEGRPAILYGALGPGGGHVSLLQANGRQDRPAGFLIRARPFKSSCSAAATSTPLAIDADPFVCLCYLPLEGQTNDP